MLPGMLLAAALLPAGYPSEIQAWRREREENVKADWLTLAGLHWLQEGSNSFGSAPSNLLVLPAGPARAGVFEFRGGKTTVRAAPGVTITLDRRAITTRELRSDKPGPADMLRLGDLTLHVIQRGRRYGIRVRDPNSPERRAFRGLKWFVVRESWRVRARWVPHQPPKTISIPTILGDVEPMSSPGYVVFTLAGREHRLEPVVDGEELFFLFRDATAGRETYPAGRFLNTPMPKDGAVILDFNKSYNPPCAYTKYATCPLPPKQNHLPVRIEAGEIM